MREEKKRFAARAVKDRMAAIRERLKSATLSADKRLQYETLLDDMLDTIIAIGPVVWDFIDRFS